MAGRINTVMQPCYFALSDVMPLDEALDGDEGLDHEDLRSPRPPIVEKNHAAIDRALDELVEVDVPAAMTATPSSADQLAAATAAGASDFVERVTMQMIAGKGDLLPVSAMPVDGTFPTGTTQFEKRKLATEIPIWEPDLCIDCGKCAIVCPHAAIRMKAYEPDALDAAPDGFLTKSFRSRELVGHQLTVQVAPDDCTGCGICVDVCPAKDKTEVKRKSINMRPAAEHRDVERERWDFFGDDPRTRSHGDHPRLGQELTAPRAALRVLGGVFGLRRDAVPQAAHPALR